MYASKPYVQIGRLGETFSHLRLPILASTADVPVTPPTRTTANTLVDTSLNALRVGSSTPPYRPNEISRIPFRAAPAAAVPAAVPAAAPSAPGAPIAAVTPPAPAARRMLTGDSFPAPTAFHTDLPTNPDPGPGSRVLSCVSPVAYRRVPWEADDGANHGPAPTLC